MVKICFEVTPENQLRVKFTWPKTKSSKAQVSNAVKLASLLRTLQSPHLCNYTLEQLMKYGEETKSQEFIDMVFDLFNHDPVEPNKPTIPASEFFNYYENLT